MSYTIVEQLKELNYDVKTWLQAYVPHLLGVCYHLDDSREDYHSVEKIFKSLDDEFLRSLNFWTKEISKFKKDLEKAKTLTEVDFEEEKKQHELKFDKNEINIEEETKNIQSTINILSKFKDSEYKEIITGRIDELLKEIEDNEFRKKYHTRFIHPPNFKDWKEARIRNIEKEIKSYQEEIENKRERYKKSIEWYKDYINFVEKMFKEENGPK